MAMPAEDEEWAALLREAQARANPAKAATSGYAPITGNGVRDVDPNPPPLHPLTGHVYQPPREKEQHPDYGGDVAATVGAGQGLTGGFSAKGGALLDTFLSKAPPALRASLESLNAAGGGHPGLSPLTADKTFSERLGEYNQRNTDLHATHPGAMLGGQLLGGAALGAGAPGAIPTSMGGAIGRGAAGGAIAGAGYSKGDPSTPEGLVDTGLDAAGGAAVGGALSAAGHAIGKVAEGAPERIDKRNVDAISEDSKRRFSDAIYARREDVAKVIREDKDLAKVISQPKEVLPIVADRLAKDSATTDRIYATAFENASKNPKIAANGETIGGGVPSSDVLGTLNVLKNDFANKSQPEKAAVVDKLINAYRGGLGKDPNQPANPVALREWITSVQKRATTADPQAETPLAKEALRDASTHVRAVLHGYVDEHAPGLLPELEAANRRTNVHRMIEDSALEQARRDTVPAGPIRSAAGFVKNAMSHGPTGTGALVGAGAAHLMGASPITGAAVGAAAGSALKAAAPIADKAMASKLGQWTMFGAGRAAAKAIPQPIIDQAAQGDDIGLRQHLQQSIFGDDKPGGAP